MKVASILPESPAANSTLQAGDFILDVNGRTLEGLGYDDCIRQFADSGSFTLGVMRVDAELHTDLEEEGSDRGGDRTGTSSATAGIASSPSPLYVTCTCMCFVLSSYPREYDPVVANDHLCLSTPSHIRSPLGGGWVGTTTFTP